MDQPQRFHVEFVHGVVVICGHQPGVPFSGSSRSVCHLVTRSCCDGNYLSSVGQLRYMDRSSNMATWACWNAIDRGRIYVVLITTWPNNYIMWFWWPLCIGPPGRKWEHPVRNAKSRERGYFSEWCVGGETPPRKVNRSLISFFDYEKVASFSFGTCLDRLQWSENTLFLGLHHETRKKEHRFGFSS